MQLTSLALAAFMVTASMDASADPGKQIRIVKQVAPQPGVKAPADKDMAAYLFVYFKDQTHSIHFATSTDGYTFTDINGGDPVLLGKDVSEQQGVRDPHIMRGPDGAFYMSMTDLHIFAQREGLRKTEWERPGSDYGWGNDRALILMKSFDLVNWTHALTATWAGSTTRGSPMKTTDFSSPKHGTVMHITAEELRRLQAYLGSKGA